VTPHTPPSLSVWLVRTLVPASQRETILEVLTDGYRAQVSSRGPAEACRWYRAQTAEHVWASMRPGVAAAALAFLTHGGIVVVAPWARESWSRWLAASWPEALLLLASAHTAWRTRRWTAGLVSGTLSSCLVTAGAQVAFVAGLAIGQPSLFRLGLTWASLRDLAELFITNGATGTVIAAAGGLVGRMIAIGHHRAVRLR
jgi:hypothetical protein